MIRRRITLFVVAAMIALPQLGNALPRQELGIQEKSVSYASVQTFTVASNGNLVFSQTLKKGLQYRFKVTGVWQWGSSTSQKADMAFSTSDGWSSASKTAGGRSLEIAGLKQADTTVAYSSAHSYNVDKVFPADGPISFKIHDDNYADNSGSLTVEVLRAQRVVYGGAITVPLLGVPTVTLEKMTVLSTTTVTAPPGTSVPFDRINYPGTPKVMTIKGRPTPTTYCFYLHTNQTGDVPSQGLCIPDPFKFYQSNFDVNVGETPTMTVCPGEWFGNYDGSCAIRPQPVTVSAVDVGPYSLPDQFWPSGFGPRPFQPGSGIQLIIEWAADKDHLFLAASALGGPDQYSAYLPFDFTNPSEIAWFQSNRLNVAATVNFAILFPDGALGAGTDGQPDQYYLLPGGIVVPGLGQFMEAAFSSKVAGR